MKKSSKILVELRDESLEDYLKRIDSKKLDLLYKKALMVTGEKKKQKVKKEDKIDIVFGDILSNVVASSLMLVDDDINQLRDILEGKKISSVSEKLLEGNYIFEEDIDGNITYYIPTEIREIIEENIIDDSKSDDKKGFVVEFYLGANGVIKFDKLVELIKETGFDIKVNELKKLVKSREYIVEDDKIYYNQIACDLDKELDLMSLKEDMDYRIFKMDEMLAIMMMMGMLSGNVKKIFNKKIEIEEKLLKVVRDIFDIVSSNSEYEVYVENYLDEKKIDLNDKEFDNLMESLLEVYMMMPSWELNGLCPFEEGLHHCDCGCEDDCDWNSEFEDLTKEEKTEVLVNAYMLINGAMRIKEMMELLDLHHGLKVKKSGIVNAVKDLDDIKVTDDYIHIDGLGTEEIEMLMSQKDEFGQYKIIEDIDLFFDEFDEVLDELDDLCMNYDLDEEVYMQVRSVLNMIGFLPEELFDEILKDANIKMNNKRKLAFVKDIKKVSSRLMVWFLNGYSANELRSMNGDVEEKIGRNDLCPCGSGKKYKKCCGR